MKDDFDTMYRKLKKDSKNGKVYHLPERHIVVLHIANTPEYIRRYYEIAGKGK